jgi:hypothetical protein
MASYNYTFNSGDTVTPTRINDARTISDIVNADVSATAAIAGTKVAPNFGSQNVVTTGNVGIGTTSPTEKIQINGNARLVGSNGIFFEINNGSDATYVSQEATAELRINQATNTTDSKITLLTRGTERMRIDASGNLLMGTTSSPVTTSKLYLSDGTINSFVGYKAGGVEQFGTHSNHPVAFLTNNAERMRIDASGNLLIGTLGAQFGGDMELRRISNTCNLDIYAAGDASASNVPKLRFYNNAANAAIGASGGNLVFFSTTVNDERMRLDVNGNLGIGSSTPIARLDVQNGSVNTSEHYRVDGTQVVSNRATGWAAPTGTATRTTFATSTVTTAQLAERVKALIDDLTSHGLIGA